jgi:hypothetical protein
VGVSAQPVEEPGDSRQADPGQQPALSALADALRKALATAPREQVLSRIATTLPIEIESGPDSGLHGKVQQGKAQKVSVSMPAELADLVRSRTGAGGFSRYVTEAVQGRIKHDLLGDLLDELEAEYGPVPAEVREQTRRMWPDQTDD